MKRLFWIMLCVSTPLSVTHGDEGELTTHFQFQKGSPIIVRFDYHGGIEEWDARASIADGKLILSNAMFISITNARGELVKPLEDKTLSIWADTYFRDPFNLVFDITKYYDFSQTDQYVVQWGCSDVESYTVLIYVID